MYTRRNMQLGYTLAELLISLAIIAMISGLAIPAVTKIGGFMNKKSDSAARDLFGVLRASRISAISNRNDTAVVYNVSARPDNFTNGLSFVADGYGIASRATKEQYAEIVSDVRYEDLLPDEVFVLAQDPQARFRKMPKDTAVIGHLTAQEEQTLRSAGYVDQIPQSIDEFKAGLPDAMDPARMYEGMQSRGMRIIYLFQVSDGTDELLPLDTMANLTMDTSAASLDNAFPAHVFRPTGELSVPGASLDAWKERVTIAVGPSPDAPKEDRFTVSPEESGGPAVMAAPVRIELYRSTGRVQIAS